MRDWIMRAFAEAWPGSVVVQQAVGQLSYKQLEGQPMLAYLLRRLIYAIPILICFDLICFMQQQGISR